VIFCHLAVEKKNPVWIQRIFVKKNVNQLIVW
jgi:hypothetical protein